MNYFGVALKYNDSVEVDHWLRRRVRMCYWKLWRRAKKRIGELIKLGAPRYHAILTGLSRKGYWHLSMTLSTNCGLGNEFLQKQGLTSIRTLWIQVHYPAKASLACRRMISAKRPVRTRMRGVVGRDG